ncbi:N-acetylneuraminate synthase family protein [Amylibacter sp.]|nr:N-acetylneuraminate synthase family protein [Amylibacter sp.]
MLSQSKFPELIVEIANSHDGNSGRILELINVVSDMDYSNKSIKFQIFSPDTIALKDFEWFDVYQKITFDDVFWKEILETAHKKVKHVWIDIFDSYGVEIFNSNKNCVSGLKLQASVLENYEVRCLLSDINLSETKLIINVSGIEITKLKHILCDFKKLNFKEIILQIGFQSYPTKIEDTGLQKISILNDNFENSICLADHIDGLSEAAIDIPLLGIAFGAQMIEKHICLDRISTKFDHFSSLEPDQFAILIDKIKSFQSATFGPFISASEFEYLEKSIQTPVLANKILAGSIVSLEDLKFRRTSQEGLSYLKLLDLQKKFMILSSDIDKNTCINTDNFRRAKVGVIIAGRLKSSRLKKKALLPILKKPSIQWCFDSCSKIASAEEVIIATSTEPEDTELVKMFNHQSNAKVFTGHPVDVINRYLAACSKFKIDVVIRVTADCPFISEEIAEILLKAHFESGADYTAARDFSVGTSCEIINTRALKTVVDHMGETDLSEYMTWYFQNNPDIFKVNIVDLPSSLIRSYRLTLDYQEDLDMFDALLRKMGDKPINIKNIFKILDVHPDINKINSHKGLLYKEELELVNKLDKFTKIHL